MQRRGIAARRLDRHGLGGCVGSGGIIAACHAFLRIAAIAGTALFNLRLAVSSRDDPHGLRADAVPGKG